MKDARKPASKDRRSGEVCYGIGELGFDVFGELVGDSLVGLLLLVLVIAVVWVCRALLRD